MGAVMRAALEGRGDSALKVLGVTVLTSFDQKDLDENGYHSTVADLVHLRARNAAKAGIDGVVCSPLDAARVRRVVGPGRLIVTPGVRSRSAAVGDQKRIATPEDAIRDGADYLVIGRQVTRASDPAAEARRIMEDIAA
jgi:orotidine-5'-phosphate decarboxylase